MRALELMKRWFLRAPACPDPNHPDCRRRQDEERRNAILREQHEYLDQAEDEIAVMMRQRQNGH